MIPFLCRMIPSPPPLDRSPFLTFSSLCVCVVGREMILRLQVVLGERDPEMPLLQVGG
jgi:hypothetical protein